MYTVDYYHLILSLAASLLMYYLTTNMLWVTIVCLVLAYIKALLVAHIRLGVISDIHNNINSYNDLFED